MTEVKEILGHCLVETEGRREIAIRLPVPNGVEKERLHGI